MTPEQRHRTMSRIRGKNTKPEMVVRRLLHGSGYGYRLHAMDLPGRPDVVFRGRHKVIFVNGCFWHTHSCPSGQHAPANNAEFWAAKRLRTIERDAANLRLLQDRSWGVLTVWECEMADTDELLLRLRGFLD
ncbi:very short patch repair endonuclease [Arthrobacter sp. 35W]|uniref:very short patch repair endonuclease n=1 Tax=Arthrobacter sp. 35W TaxID=1132441 RepID=UPI00055788D6|nr:very short patch repair endonuclease [Arthrobacter sp. 35W]